MGLSLECCAPWVEKGYSPWPQSYPDSQQTVPQCRPVLEKRSYMDGSFYTRVHYRKQCLPGFHAEQQLAPGAAAHAQQSMRLGFFDRGEVLKTFFHYTPE